MTDGAAAVRVRAMLEERGRDKTICPSEVARALVADGDDWRMAMPAVHAAVDVLLAAQAIRISWRGKALGERSGPYRIGTPD